MARSLHVRLDDASVAALAIVRTGGMTDSEAVRTALVLDALAGMDRADRDTLVAATGALHALAAALGGEPAAPCANRRP